VSLEPDANPAPPHFSGHRIEHPEELDLLVVEIVREAGEVVSLWLVAPDGRPLPPWSVGVQSPRVLQGIR
jgi:hypothetical protein